MRHIRKGAEPSELTDWKLLENEDWTPTYPTLQNPQKAILKSQLLAEQFFTCCYCGRSINSSDSHIEHFRPQEAAPELQLKYSNLLASCIRETPKNSQLHCGHLKDSWFEENLAISPLDETCESRFSYLLTGVIHTSQTEDVPAQTMIEVLGLNSEYLKNRREAALQGAFDASFLETTTINELDSLIEGFSQPIEGKLQSFYHVIVRFAHWQKAFLANA